MKSDQKTWEKLGELAPYHSVLVAEQFKPENLSEESLAAFFDSGREHVARLMEIVREFRPQFMPRMAVDFGCGVGRITVPLAKISSRVLAVDISKPMLDEAKKNCAKRGVDNVRFMTTAEFLRLPDASADFLHSFIVLQHVPPAKGHELVEKLIATLEEGGIGAIHVTFHDNRSPVRWLLSWIKSNVPGAAQLHNLLRRQPLNYPPMQMHVYSLDRIFRILHERGCHKVLSRFSEHGQHLGMFLIFEKSKLNPF
jgi:2-polyprenyl-3-methyl-5-hydroxy-6-metoxy-1,4-benzoquinol methylase